MKYLNYLLLIISFALFPLWVIGQNCPEGSITLKDQEDVDEFVANYPNCTTIDGEFLIGEFGNPAQNDIVDISGLSNLIHIVGALKISRCEFLTDLNGLQGIEHADRVEMFDNRGLIDISGLNGIGNLRGGFSLSAVRELSSFGMFSNIDSINGTMRFSGLKNLSLEAFPNLKYAGSIAIDDTESASLEGIPLLSEVGGNIRINYNDNLEYINAFGSLRTVGGDFSIYGNDLLNEIIGFNSLETVSEDFKLYESPLLSSMDNAFGSLENVGALFRIEETNLTNLYNFDNIKSVGPIEIIANPSLESIFDSQSLNSFFGILEITGNESLVSLDGFDNVIIDSLFQGPSLFVFRVRNNLNLTVCDQQFLCDLFKRSFIVNFTNNGEGCSSFDAVYYNKCRNHECLSNGIEFIRQSQIDSFSINHPLCTYIPGDVTIGDPNGIAISDIVNLDGLQQIDTIIGNTIINNNPLLIDLSGLNNVDQSGALSIQNNVSLEELSVFKDSKAIFGDLIIRNNPALHTYSAPRAFFTVQGDFIIEDNPILSNIKSFLSLLSISGDLIIKDLTTSTPVIEMENLELIGGDFIYSNVNESSIATTGLVRLQNIGGNVMIENNQNSDIPFLARVDTVLGDFIIRNNDKPTGLFISNYIGGDLIIENNDNFTGINNSLFKTEYVGGDLIVKGNDKLRINNTVGNSGLENLTNLKSINGRLIIEDNLELQSLNGLEAIAPNGISEIRLVNNPKLSKCNIQAICGLLIDNNAAVTISENKDICETKIRVEEKCELSHCYSNSFVLTEQESVNKMIDETKTCSVIEGDLDVMGGANPKSLLGLEHIKIIEGDLNFKNTGTLLNNLEGLNNLERIGGDLDALYFYTDDMTGLDNLESIDGEIFIRESGIKSFVGLYSLKRIGSISTAFDETTTSFNGLESVEEITNGISLVFSAFKSLDGIQNVKHFGGSLRISQCDSLTDIFAIKDFQADSLASMNISGNLSLSECSVQVICDFILQNPTFTVVNNNNLGCQAKEDLECEYNSIKGTVYYDVDGDGIRDSGENGIPNISVEMPLLSTILITNQDGEFQQYVDSGEQYSVLLEQDPDWTLTSSQVNYIGVFDPSIPMDLDFGLQPNFMLHQSALNITSDNIRCNEEGKYYLTIQNTGTFTENGEFRFMYNPLVSFLSSSVEPLSHDATTGIITWDYTDLKPFDIIKIELIMEMPNETYTGINLSSELIIYDGNAEYEDIISEYKYETILRCSYDPNDKQINPVGVEEEAYILTEDNITYTIRFQNTGNDYARDVRLIDSIDNRFDMETFRVVNSSHDVYTEITGNVVTFNFDDIYLIDSTSNSAESKGFVSFSMSVFEDTPDFSIVENFADIYFDFNPPIRTNTLTNTIVENFPTATKNIGEEENISINPNPSFGSIQFSSTENEVMQIYNAQMQSVNAPMEILRNRLYSLDLTRFQSGLYYFVFRSDNGYDVKKIVLIQN